MVWVGKLPLHDTCHLYDVFSSSSNRDNTEKKVENQAPSCVLGIFLLYGSWNSKVETNTSCIQDLLEGLMKQHAPQQPLFLDSDDDSQTATPRFLTGMVQVDETDESLELCCGDDNATEYHRKRMPQIPPETLPAFFVAGQGPRQDHAHVEFVLNVPAHQVLQLVCQNHRRTIDASLPHRWNESLVRNHLLSVWNQTGSPTTSNGPLRIFVAGDRSSVGKSSTCLGLLGCLLHMGYPPSTLAYIKPATQSESHQLIQIWCQQQGIACVPIGPVVYYRGFTRAFLQGATDSTELLLKKAAVAVDQLAEGKQVVLLDGVGYPAVGSICGTDNAAVATACGYPDSTGKRRPAAAVLVGPSGVGNAVDSFNLNATFLESKGVPVLGPIFNKLALEGFYSLEQCRAQVTAYFQQNTDVQKGRMPFGFCPVAPGIAGEAPMNHVEDFILTFQQHVNVKAILEAAARHKAGGVDMGDGTKAITSQPSTQEVSRPTKRQKQDTVHDAGDTVLLSRDVIEARAIAAGAAPSA